MRFSGSTPSPPEALIRLGIVVVGDDHARACTGRRLIRRGWARELRRLPDAHERFVLLDPYARRPLTRGDLPRAVAGGLVAVDCSWNRLSAERARHPADFPTSPSGRRLPMLVAANPQHFGRLGELNTAEALAAALAVLGRPTEAARLLDGFAGGRTFLDVNRARLDRYARAASPDEIERAERVLFGGP